MTDGGRAPPQMIWLYSDCLVLLLIPLGAALLPGWSLLNPSMVDLSPEMDDWGM